MHWEPSMWQSSPPAKLPAGDGGMSCFPPLIQLIPVGPWIYIWWTLSTSESHHLQFRFCGFEIHFPKDASDVWMHLAITAFAFHLYLNHTCTRGLNPSLEHWMHRKEWASSVVSCVHAVRREKTKAVMTQNIIGWLESQMWPWTYHFHQGEGADCQDLKDDVEVKSIRAPGSS